MLLWLDNAERVQRANDGLRDREPDKNASKGDDGHGSMLQWLSAR